jgi:hypothetical protein
MFFSSRKKLFHFFLATLIPFGFLIISGRQQVLTHIFQFLFITAVYLGTIFLLSKIKTDSNGLPFLLLLLAAFVFLILGIHLNQPIFSWLFIGFYFIFLLLSAQFFEKLTAVFRFFGYVILFLSAGIIPGLVNQIILRFSEEEFFTFLMVFFLSVFWLLQWISFHFFLREHKQDEPKPEGEPISLGRKLLITNLLILVSVIIIAVYKYQNSFYTHQPVETYPGITEENPILCEELAGENDDIPTTVQSVQDDYAKAISRKESLQTVDYGFLASYYQSEPYYSQFRDSLLSDAISARYTQPANSVKWDQLLASHTLYYYLKLSQDKPDLFTDAQTQLINTWISAINERAQTAEWVDWMYGLAFSHKPVGAYLNQDIGAGLYAILNQLDATSSDFREKNQAFLTKNLRGWEQGFRVMDDALSYQSVWITNSYFQALLAEDEINKNTFNSFDWILAQALPDVGLQTYNFPEKTSIGPISLFGSLLLEDPNLLWLANKSLETLGPNYSYYTQPGAEQKISNPLIAEKPRIGSCLIYGNSGLPEQRGPLTPDKIILRNGWENNDFYIMLNLRFSGWHRYKATNGISLIYAGTPLIEEQYTQGTIPWLPIGRALVRDKRIPIEQLNTLLIPRTGLDAVLNTLNNWFGPYSQDPPYYANIDKFITTEDFDYSKTHVNDWHNWRFTREIYLYNDGFAIIFDEAETESKKSAEIRWHLSADFSKIEDNRFQSANGNFSVQLVAQENGEFSTQSSDDHLTVNYKSPKTGKLKLITVILSGRLKTAKVEAINDDSIVFRVDDQLISYPLIP